LAAPVSRIEGFWSAFLGVSAAALREPGVTLAPHAQLSGWNGVWLWARGRSLVVSAPAEWIEVLEPRSAAAPRALGGDPEALRSLFGERMGAVIGPSYHGVLEAAHFSPVRRGEVRPLAAADAAALASLREACDPAEWEHGNLEHAGRRFGAFCEGELVAAAALRPWPGGARDPGVVTHPRHRGRGHGAAAVSAAVEEALAEGQLVVYQTLRANRPAVALARRLGFADFASHLAVRLLPPPKE
jgi:GNAT superfamily N-acetyltransferase